MQRVGLHFSPALTSSSRKTGQQHWGSQASCTLSPPHCTHCGDGAWTHSPHHPSGSCSSNFWVAAVSPCWLLSSSILFMSAPSSTFRVCKNLDALLLFRPQKPQFSQWASGLCLCPELEAAAVANKPLARMLLSHSLGPPRRVPSSPESVLQSWAIRFLLHVPERPVPLTAVPLFLHPPEVPCASALVVIFWALAFSVF